METNNTALCVIAWENSADGRSLRTERGGDFGGDSGGRQIEQQLQ